MNKGWPVTRLGDLTDLVTKGTTPTSIGHAFVEDGINFVKVESITTTGQFIEEKFAHITPACHAVLGRSQLQAGDILFSIAGALGRTGFVTDDILPANTNQALAIIRLKRDVGLLPKFVLKALETGVVLEQIEKFKGGVAQQNLSLAQVRDFQIALPPLAEQQRIVGLLDEAFEGLATAKANAEKNLQNARALFESHLQSVFTQRGPGWVEKTLGDICVVDWGNTDLTKSSYVEGGKYLAVSAAGCDGRIGHKEHAKHTPVLSAIGAQCGRMFLPEEDFTAIKNTITLTPRDGTCAGKFLYRLLTHVELPKRGAAQPFIAKGDILKFQIVVPEDSETQLRIVDSLDDLEEETQRHARLYEQKLAALEALKKSLLHQAFTGSL